MNADDTQHLVVMGVSGCGKSTVAEGLAAALGWPFDEGDRFHPQTSIDKMAAGVPLTDEDRWPWLRILADRIAAREREGRPSILSCSSLRRAYRDVLRSGAPRVRFLHLHGDRAVLAERLGARTDHFFPADLLDSQFAALETLGPDEDGVVVDVALGPAEQVREGLRRLGLG
ncbi:MAG: gluconokinase [Geminicoccaceae bacterium]